MLTPDDEQAMIRSLADADGIWDAYDKRDQDLRQARWSAICVAWVMAGDEVTVKLLGYLLVPELVDLKASLASLSHEIDQAIDRAEQDEP